MPRYRVTVERTQTHVVEVDALSEADAQATAIECVHTGDTMYTTTEADVFDVTEVAHLQPPQEESTC